MVGSAIAMDLAKDAEVRVVDRSPAALARVADRYGVATHEANLSRGEAITEAVADADVVVGALASHLGFGALRAVIEAGKPYVDISFMAEDFLELSALAAERGVTAVVDCGVAPGMSNMSAGRGVASLARCDRLEIYVGGLPVERRWPYEYKAGFAPADVIEEYTRPARMVEHGEVVVYPALSGIELLDFEGLGTLEAFRTDGLRSLIHTLEVPTMVEKTMRYPGHAELMRAMRDTGLFSKEPVVVKGEAVVPLALTSALLFPKWTFEEGEADLTVMRVATTGVDSQGERIRHRWDLVDRYDPATGLRSMSRTTGFPAAIVARMLARGEWSRPGVPPPEILGKEEAVFDHVLAELKQRGVIYHHHLDRLES